MPFTPRLDGIDTSHYQRFSATVPLPPLKFAMHKATEGIAYRDPTLFDATTRYRNSPQVEHVGFYLYLRGKQDVREQVAHFVRTIADTVGTIFPSEFVVIDWERGSDLTFPTWQNVEYATKLLHGFIPGNRVAVYSAPWVPGMNRWRKRNPLIPFFLANYNTNPATPGNGWDVSKTYNAVVWQWSSTTPVQGVTSRCDSNQVNDYGWFDAMGVKDYG